MTVTVDDRHLASIDDVANDLRGSGMRVGQVLRELGIITGSVDFSRRASLRSVDGVLSVDSAVNFHLPPPDSPIQ